MTAVLKTKDLKEIVWQGSIDPVNGNQFPDMIEFVTAEPSNRATPYLPPTESRREFFRFQITDSCAFYREGVSLKVIA